MRCEEIREKISMMVDGELRGEDRLLVTEHLAACPDCMQVYEAFAAISESLGELEAPPEGFADAVMEKVRLQARKPRLRRQVTRFACAAACVALILFAGNTMGMFRMGRAADSAATGLDGASFAPVNQEMETVGAADMDAETVYAQLMDYDSATLYAEEPENQTMLTVQGDSVRDAAPEELEAAANTAPVTDLRDLLAVETPAEYGIHDGAPDYTVSFSDDAGNCSLLLVWVDGSRLYCEAPGEQTAYYAVGSADAFLAVFEE